MTITELSKKYNIAESTISDQFKRVQNKILKKYKTEIIKQGRGKDADYIEIPYKDSRAEKMIDEPKEQLMITKESLVWDNWDLICLLAIIATPSLVFRGSYKDFLAYVELKFTAGNMKNLKESLQRLFKNKYILYVEDTTNDNYFIATLTWGTERKMIARRKMVQICQELAIKYHKRSWIPLLKTWLGVEILVEEAQNTIVNKNKQSVLFTMDELMNLTNLSINQIKDSHKILKESQIYKASRAYVGYQKCIGTIVELNGFYEDKN